MRTDRWVAAICFLVLGLRGMASSGAAGLAPEDFAKLPVYGSPSVSPDGQYLALSVHNNGAKWNESDYQLVVFKLPSLEGVSRLNMAPFYRPASVTWVSNTRLVMALAYSSGSLEAPQGTGEVIALNYDGSQKQTLYSARSRGSTDSGIHSKDMPAGAATIASLPYPLNGHVYLELNVYPDRLDTDDERFERSQIYDVDSLSGRATLAGDIDKPDMSFVLHDGVARVAYGESSIGVLDTYVRKDAGDSWHRLDAAVTGNHLEPLRISRDGTKLWSLYSARGAPQALVETDLEGGNRRVLAGDDFAAVDDVLWSRKTGAPYAAIFGAGRYRVAYLDQSLPAKVLKALSDKFPDHLVQLRGGDEQEQNLLVVAESDRDPGSVALFDTRTMNLRPLYQVEDWIHAEQMAERRPIRFKAGDGVEIEGFVTLPNGRPATNLPTVLLPHGGPIGPRDEWTYEPDAQFLASLGYAVVQVNYRGSGGRGPAFEDAGYKHFGDRIQQDLLDGLHWAIAQGLTDAKRVCVYGGSFGGYSSLMLPILAPGEFKCAIDYAGVSDWTINFRSSDTSHSLMGRDYFAKAIGDEAAARAISPLYRLESFNVPVLIVHGEEDKRVPIQNARAVRDALKKADKTVEVLFRPKEGHGFYSEENRTDLYKTMQQFLAKYLGSSDQGAPR